MGKEWETSKKIMQKEEKNTTKHITTKKLHISLPTQKKKRNNKNNKIMKRRENTKITTTKTNTS